MGRIEEAAHCRRCGHAFTSLLHARDLIQVERELGYRYEIDDHRTEHYQWICPPCRRAIFAMAQGLIWDRRRGGGLLSAPKGLLPMPVYINGGIGEGPLGVEDSENFHP